MGLARALFTLISPPASAWLATQRHPRAIHVFFMDVFPWLCQCFVLSHRRIWSTEGYQWSRLPVENAWLYPRMCLVNLRIAEAEYTLYRSTRPAQLTVGTGMPTVSIQDVCPNSAFLPRRIY
ncbi:hypothetical protein K474DRAFT_1664583 [Panus rudis PR-1116 ss-1]|nr:hypothetical protein K474DRAFT_1664583 [Panus rudis PR-1116 ss-1]